MDPAVADAHPLIWAASANLRKLGRAALYLPAHALLEIGEAHAAGDFSFSGRAPLGQWVDRLTSSGRYVAIDLTTEIVRRVQKLYEIPERGDRIVAATASVMGCPLITRDPVIARVAGLEVLW
jgi:PIN domain nuclease of toxin-antitoxin system